MEGIKTSNRVERRFVSYKQRNYGVTIYVDLDTSTFPASYDFHSFANMALKALHCCDESYYLRKVFIYGDLGEYPGLNSGQLSAGDTNAEMVVKHFPKRKTTCKGAPCVAAARPEGPKEPLATSALKKEIFLQSENEEPPYTVLLATSDADFVRTIKRLEKDDVYVLLACEPDADESLKSAVSHKWWWPDFRTGGDYQWTYVNFR